MKVIQIYKNGEMVEQECKFTKKNVIKRLTEKSKSQGNNNLKLLYTWNLGSTKLLCYGWYDGESGFENTHDLPPAGISEFLENDSSEKLIFGDLFIVKMEKNKYSEINVFEYSDYYNSLYGGFDDCDSEEEDKYSEEENYEEVNIELEYEE